MDASLKHVESKGLFPGFLWDVPPNRSFEFAFKFALRRIAFSFALALRLVFALHWIPPRVAYAFALRWAL